MPMHGMHDMIFIRCLPSSMGVGVASHGTLSCIGGVSFSAAMKTGEMMSLSGCHLSPVNTDTLGSVLQSSQMAQCVRNSILLPT